MAKRNRKGIVYSDLFMKIMKDKKHKKMRNIPIDKEVTERKYNDADRVI